MLFVELIFILFLGLSFFRIIVYLLSRYVIHLSATGAVPITTQMATSTATSDSPSPTATWPSGSSLHSTATSAYSKFPTMVVR